MGIVLSRSRPKDAIKYASPESSLSLSHVSLQNGGASLRKFAATSFPYILLSIYCVVIAKISLTIAQNTHDPVKIFETGCLENADSYNHHIYYALSLVSTIGYGGLMPCSNPLKLFSLICSLLGLPLFFFLLLDSGERLAKFCHRIQVQTRMREARKRLYSGASEFSLMNNKHGDKDGMEVNIQQLYEELEQEDLQPWIGPLGFAVIYCVLVLYYYYGELHMPSDAFYYSAMLFLAGDFRLSNFGYAPFIYFVVLCGLIMLSMTINTILDNIHRLLNRIQASVKQQIATAMEKGGPVPVASVMMEKALKTASKLAIAAVPKEKMTEVTGRCETMAQDAEQVLELKSQLEVALSSPRRSPARTHVATSKPAAEERSDGSCQSDPITTADAGTACATVETRSFASSPIRTNSSYSQCLVPAYSDVALQWGSPLPVCSDASALAQVDTRGIGTQLGNTRAESGVQVKPSTRTVKLQHPKSSRASFSVA